LLSIVIPIYNEEENLISLHEELKGVLDPISVEYEILMVDDGSTDKSFEMLRKLGESDDHTHIIKLRRNYGQTAALLAGFKTSRGEIVVSMDADLQNDPNDIPKLLETIEEGWDVVCGWRWVRNDPFTKRIPSKISNWFARRIMDVKVHDLGCTLRAYRRRAVENLELYGELHRYLPILISSQGFRITEVKVNHRERLHGETKYGVSRIFTGFFDLMSVKFLLSYSRRPMLVFGGMGLTLMLLGMVFGLYMVIEKYVYGVSIGDKPLLMLAVLLILSGLQFISTGLIADMIKRTHYTTKQAYEIEETI
jgi:glycosyltransferase involved in cell wall biosynthesis